LKHASTIGRALLVLSLLLILGAGVEAADVRVESTDRYCFSQADFISDGETIEGVYVCSVPSSAVGSIRCGARTLCAGDVLPAGMLNQLVLEPGSGSEPSGSLFYRPIANGTLGESKELKLRILSGENLAPVAESSSFETYKNVANTGTLKASDPEGDALTYTLVKEPKRGTVTLGSDGSFIYTPLQNKVGRDKFVFTASDQAGNVSQEATVTIKIVKPTDKAMYADLSGDSAEYAAMWLKERGIYKGQSVAGSLCFCPDSSVTRGEFLVMAMKLLGEKPDGQVLATGFADESATPVWMQPYLAAAFKNGVISGVNSDGGMVFRPDAALTKAEAAVMLQNILRLPESDAASVFAIGSDADAVPAWAARAVNTLHSAGIVLPAETSADTISRREAAELLMKVCQYAESGASSGLAVSK
jgi:hypothetical protein